MVSETKVVVMLFRYCAGKNARLLDEDKYKILLDNFRFK